MTWVDWEEARSRLKALLEFEEISLSSGMWRHLRQFLRRSSRTDLNYFSSIHTKWLTPKKTHITIRDRYHEIMRDQLILQQFQHNQLNQSHKEFQLKTYGKYLSLGEMSYRQSSNWITHVPLLCIQTIDNVVASSFQHDRFIVGETTLHKPI